jgi:hypothetical protein
LAIANGVGSTFALNWSISLLPALAGSLLLLPAGGIMRRHPTLELLGLGLGLSILAGCPDRNVSQVDPNQNKVEVKDIPVQLNRDLDLLFMIDNSGSMEEEQSALTANFPAFTNVLQTIEGGLPNIHLAVVSSDVGAGPSGIGGCDGSGDNGQFQTSTAVTGNFINDVAADPPGSGNCPGDPDRDCNYDGTLATAFADMATLGTGGCGFEQHFESVRRALNGSNGSNAGFLRDSAFLGVVFVQDEDDCSTQDANMFNSSTEQDNPTSELGPLSSFRCNEFGIQCETGNDDPRAVGPRTNCSPLDPSPYMYGVDEYVDFFKGLKSDEDLLIMAGITAPAEPYVVGRDPREPANPAIVPACTNEVGIACSDTTPCPGTLLSCVNNQCVSHADPAVRLHYFLDQFPQSASTTICSNNLSDGLQLIAELLKEAIGNPCIQSTLEDPIECSVSDVVHPDEDNEVETLMPACNQPEPTPLDPTDSPASTNTPCWHLEADPAKCDTPTTLSLVVERADVSPPTGTHVRAQCVTCTDINQNGTCDHAE